MPKNYRFLLIILIIASFLRLANLTSLPPGLYPDEAMNGNNALEAFSTGEFKIFYPENNGREGLFINIQSVFVGIFGNIPWALRLPSVLFGILTVAGIYFLTRELLRHNKYKEFIALTAAFLLATNFWHINFSRIGFRAIMAPFFLTWGLYLLFKIAENKKAILYAILGGLVYGLGFYSYIAYRATPAIILLALVYLWFEMKKSGNLKQFYLSSLAFCIATIITVSPLLLYFADHPEDFLGRTSQISIFSSGSPLKDLSLNTLKTIGMFNFVGDFNWRHNIAGRPELFWPVGILFIIGIVISLKSILKKTENIWPAFMIISWMGVAALPVVISNEGLPHALRAILMAPAAIILAAWGGSWVYEKLKDKMPEVTLKKIILVTAAVLTIEAYSSYFLVWGNNLNTADAFSQNYVRLAEELNRLPAETPKIVIVNADGVLVRGIPMPAQTVMFLTDTFREENRVTKNIFYLSPEEFKLTTPREGAVIRLLND